MKTRDFLSKLRQTEILEAIRDAEQRTSGELRVFISRKRVQDPVAEAERVFVEMGMQKTREQNGVLLFVAPRTHSFAIIGDKAVHEKCGPEFWQKLSGEMTAFFRGSHFTQGIVHGLRTAGDLLAKQFPRRPDDQNELPDSVTHD